MSDLSEVLLAVIFFLCGFTVAFTLIALKLRASTAKTVLDWATGAMITAAGLSVVVLLLLIVAFLSDDFSLDIVRKFSSKDLPFYYKISALWAGPTGSFLLWSVGVFVLFVLWLMTSANKQLAIGNTKFGAIVLSIGAGVCLAFTAILIFLAKPFVVCSSTVIDGVGLDPLLRNFWMFVHLPLLFVGYSAFLIPFVVILAAVFAGIAKDSDIYPVREKAPSFERSKKYIDQVEFKAPPELSNEVYRRLKPWLLVGICFLAVGIVTGARWSYIELGWGSYWAWDSVENVSLLPLLVSLAALHSLIGIRVADKFRFWTIILAPLPFILCLFVAFVTRSGILPSLHSFTHTVSSWQSTWRSPDFSTALSVFIVCCFLLWLICIICMVKSSSISLLQASGFHLDKREALFWADVVFVLTAVAIGVVTFWPVIWQAITSFDLVVTLPPLFYNRIILVAAVFLAFLVGCAALTDLKEHRGFILQLLGCCAAGLLCFGFLLRYGQIPLLLKLTCGICVFSFIAVLIKLVLNLKQAGQIASGIAHLGLLLLVVAAGFSSDRLSVQTILNEEESFELGEYELFYDSFRSESVAGVIKEGPEIVLVKENLQKKLWPHQCLYPNGQRAAEVAVHTGLLEDVYISFDRLSKTGSVIVTAKVKPFMLLLWLAAVLIVAGLALALFEKEP